MDVTLEAIRSARERIAGAVRLTPVWPSLALEQIAGEFPKVRQRLEREYREGLSI